jgi:hypothetical protein
MLPPSATRRTQTAPLREHAPCQPLPGPLAIVFAFAAFALRHTTLGGALEEPLLLLLMGTLFLVVGKLFKGPSRKPAPAPQMVQREG